MKIDQLTFTRFIAAIAIVIFHFGERVFPFNYPYINTLVANANVGVSYFFILSGFVMIFAYNSSKEIDVPTYYKNRFARIYPLYIVALLLSVALLINSHVFNLMQFLFSITLLQAWVPKYTLTLNFPGWSLSVEMLFYMLFPVLYNFFYKKQHLKTIAITISIFWLFSQILFKFSLRSRFYADPPAPSGVLILDFPLLHLNQFLFGNLLGMLYLKIKNRVQNVDIVKMILSAAILLFIYFNFRLNLHRIIASIILLLVIIIISFYKGSNNKASTNQTVSLNKINGLSLDLLIVLTVIAIILSQCFDLTLLFHNGLMAILFGPLILMMALNTGVITRIFSKRICILLGEISYGIYILQYPIHLLTDRIFGALTATRPSLYFFSYLIILLAVSFMCYFLIETPARRFIKAWAKPKNQP